MNTFLNIYLRVLLVIVERVSIREARDTDLDSYLCCDGTDCTCEGTTIRDYLLR